MGAQTGCRSSAEKMKTTLTANQRMGLVAAIIVAADQLTKVAVLRYLRNFEEKVILEGFFKFVHWRNTGAAWSLFSDHNALLSVVSLVALLVLFLTRHHFEAHTVHGQISLGFIFGGITGNLIDRLLQERQHVIDFIRFYVQRRDGSELGFPAFNVADAAICTGVALTFLLSWKNDQTQSGAS
jgi:signal peptidase II